MSTCIKTGAVVAIEEYGLIGVADIHASECAIVINFNPLSFDFGPNFPRPLTHRVSIGDGYFHRDKGILVCFHENLSEVK